VLNFSVEPNDESYLNLEAISEESGFGNPQSFKNTQGNVDQKSSN